MPGISRLWTSCNAYLFPMERPQNLSENLRQTKPRLSSDVEGRNELTVEPSVEKFWADGVSWRHQRRGLRYRRDRRRRRWRCWRCCCRQWLSALLSSLLAGNFYAALGRSHGHRNGRRGLSSDLLLFSKFPDHFPAQVIHRSGAATDAGAHSPALDWTDEAASVVGLGRKLPSVVMFL